MDTGSQEKALNTWSVPISQQALPIRLAHANGYVGERYGEETRQDQGGQWGSSRSKQMVVHWE